MIILLFGTNIKNNGIFDLDKARSIIHRSGSSLQIEDHPHNIQWDKYAWNFDIAFSLYYMYKVPDFIVKKPVINIHPGILPGFAGRGLCYQAIRNKATEFGVTAHFMDSDFDSGDIVSIKTFPINDKMNAGDISHKCGIYANTLFLELLTEICSNNTIPIGTPQDKQNRRYYKLDDIDDNVLLTPDQQLQIRAVCTDKHYAKTNINGIEYIIKKA